MELLERLCPAWIEAPNTPTRCGGGSWPLGNVSTDPRVSFVPRGTLQIRI